MFKKLLGLFKEKPLPQPQAWIVPGNPNRGRYRVLYNDGNYSMWMSKRVARDYAEIFGGVVEGEQDNAK